MAYGGRYKVKRKFVLWQSVRVEDRGHIAAYGEDGRRYVVYPAVPLADQALATRVFRFTPSAEVPLLHPRGCYDATGSRY